MPTQLTKAQRRVLQDIFPEQDCCFSPEELLVYETDAGRLRGEVLAMVRPVCEEQLVRLLRFASRENIPLYPRGRGTNTAGCCTPTRPGIAVSLLKMNRILEIDPQDFVAVVEPGVITRDLQRATHKLGLMYPPDPASIEIATIGGNVATCAGGMSAVKYGVTRDYVLGARAVLPDGRVLNFGARTHKNVVGLDVTRLLCGSEGTLAILTQITLKLIPRPHGSASVLAAFGSIDDAIGALQDIFATGILPCALEFIGKEALAAIRKTGVTLCPEGTGGCLLIKVEGTATTLSGELDRLEQALVPHAPVALQKGMGEEEEALWAVRRQINPATNLLAPHKTSDDITVPRSKLLAALTAIDAISTRYNLPIVTFGHAGDGNIHVNIMYDATTQKEQALQAKNAITDTVLSLCGVLSGEHGIGLTKADIFSRQIATQEQALMHDLKRVFDPHNILNPGKAY